MKSYLLLTLFSCSIYPLFSEVRIYFNNVKIEEGVFTTTDGGILFSEDLSLQARSIQYNKQKKILEASGDLLLQYNSRFFTADALYYDFNMHKGVAHNAITKEKVWYSGGKEITLNPDHSIIIENLFFTPYETKAPHPFSLDAKLAGISKDQTLFAKKIQAQAMGIPLFYWPRLQLNLKNLPESAIRYKVQWNSGQYPQVGFWYPLTSSDNAKATIRVEYRLGRGVDGALETESYSKNHRMSFETKNYYSYDTFYNDNNPKQEMGRYRFQGRFTTKTAKENYTVFAQYDKVSDRNLRQDFPSDQFELADPIRTEVIIRNKEPFSLATLAFRPRFNTFEGFKQELPLFDLSLAPLNLGFGGPILENRFKASYLDYVYSNNLDNTLPGFESARLETHQNLCWPRSIGGIQLLPEVGFIGIFYGNNQTNHASWQAVMNYGGKASCPLQKDFGEIRHLMTPYIAYFGLTHPTVSFSDHFIFALDDGLYQINQLTLGINNALLKTNEEPFFDWNCYFLSFFDQSSFTKTFPKLKSKISFNFSNFLFENDLGWNFQKSEFDVANFLLQWSASKDFAISLNLLHRGQYEWKKDDRSNFILDVARSISDLRSSPLSDNRDTLLTRFEWHFAPNWTFRFQHHTGWGRSTEPSYTEMKADLYTIINSIWKVRLSYMRTVRDDQVTFGMTLVPRN